ncbi:helix-turn-helix domain-containing protein [Streptomyces roseirectus]|uniref:Helix-turn-helix domain-containing protein n=1 Tax=Streptomyces roseirectus TaxID=2768066 RepID=A0A7H0IFG1_9ACTN|nr:helix-turn-helix domain-containing protein [Streptomyces roseirectus]QNP71527.1 helix-turn-helix domain-containing protein [Streptomyces roseirectus]
MDGRERVRPLLTRILRQARARRDTADVPGFNDLFGAKLTRGITQQQTARLAGVSRRWYGNLEAGRPGNYSDAFLYAVRRILDLDDDEWGIVYGIARGRAPSTPRSGPSAHKLSPVLLSLVEQSPTWGIYLSDHCWDLLACNKKAQEYFPWMSDGVNVVEWVLTSPEARTQLIDWRESWALPSMAALRVHAEKWPHDERLQEIIEKVRLDPTVRKMWDDADLPTVAYPVSSSPRRLHLPRYGGKEFTVRIIVLEPLELPNCRLVALTPAELVASG